MTKTVIELFNSPQVAQRAVAALYAYGIDQSAITVAHTVDDVTLAVLLTTTAVPKMALQRYVTGVQQGGTLVVAVVADREVQEVANLMTVAR